VLTVASIGLVSRSPSSRCSLRSRGAPTSTGLALTFAIYVLYDLGRLLGWNVEKGILSVLFPLASASALFAVWGLYRDKR
jgi:hypothetical protein